MEVPEKIYVHVKKDKVTDTWNSNWIGVNDIEYTRTDAFIEKACEWIKYNTQNGGCLFDGWEEDFKKFVED